MRRSALVLAAFAIASLTSCVQSDNPASDAKTGGIDEKLHGTWIHKDEALSSTYIVTIGRADHHPDDNWHQIAVVITSGTSVKAYSGYGFVSNLKQRRLFNLSNVGGEETALQSEKSLASQTKHYDLVQYEHVKDGLLVTFGNDISLKKAIDESLVKGKDSRLTASPAELKAFLENKSDMLFNTKKSLKFTKLKTELDK